MYGIEVRKGPDGRIRVQLRGEFDVSALGELREALDGALALRRPVDIDLRSVAFLDLGSVRELAVRSQLYAHYLTLRNPSPQAVRSIRVAGLKDWFRFDPERGPSGVCSAPF